MAAVRSSHDLPGLADGVADADLASRQLRMHDAVEVAHTLYLPGALTVPPLRGWTVNLNLRGSGRLVTRLGAEVWERQMRAGRIDVFSGERALEWSLEGTISENINISAIARLRRSAHS